MPLVPAAGQENMNLTASALPAVAEWKIQNANAGYDERFRELDTLEQYYWSKQYLHLPKDGASSDSATMPVREKQPMVIYPLPKELVDRLVDKLMGEGRGPAYSIAHEEDDKTPATVARVKLLAELMEQTRCDARLTEIARMAILAGAVALTYRVERGEFQLDLQYSKHCFPAFHDHANCRGLYELEIRYKVPREQSDGRTVDYWYRRILRQAGGFECACGKAWPMPPATAKRGKDAAPVNQCPTCGQVGTPTGNAWEDVHYKPAPVVNPITGKQDEPVWADYLETDETYNGPLPVVWLRSIEATDCVDGIPLYDAALMSMVDALNYSLSQLDKGIRYNQEPKPWNSGLKDDTAVLPYGSQFMLNLKEGGHAGLLELQGSGQELAIKYIDWLRKRSADAARVILHDPDTAKGGTTGTAWKLLNEPMMAFVDSLRQTFGPAIMRLYLLMMETIAANLDKQWAFKADLKAIKWDEPVRINTLWGDHYTPTPEDLSAVIDMLAKGREAKIIDRQSAVEYLAGEFGKSATEILARLDAEDAAQTERETNTLSAAWQNAKS